MSGRDAGTREFIENSVYKIFRISLDGTFLFASPVLLEMLAYPSLADLQTLKFTDIFRFPEQCARLMASCRKRRFVHRAEAEWRTKDQGLVAVRLHLRLLSGPGEAEQIEGVAEDVTLVRSLEQQLLQAQKFETIGLLAGGVAHDFNNVVGAILGWAELGQEETAAFPRIAERFLRIREQAERAASLTRELLAFAQCRDLKPRPVDLNTIVQSLTSFLAKVIGSDIELKLIPGILRPIHIDPMQIEQIIMNLCLNARDAMRKGGRISIQTEMVQIDDSFCRRYPDASPGWHAVVTVSDLQAGSHPAAGEREFEPLFAARERGAENGLGLASAYGIAKQLGCLIHVSRETNQTSVFRVYLPELQGDNPEAELTAVTAEVERNFN
jgi:signal transduction histidine kinase